MAESQLASRHLHRAAWIDRPLGCLAERDKMAWRSWLEQVGLPDPHVLCLEQAIVVDDDRRTVSYLTWALDDPEAGQRSSCLHKERHVVHLATEAAPFPCGHGYPWWSAFEVDDEDEHLVA
ncbi:MAG TPA: hypothetical protein VEQ66_04775 [Propionibacteriaceae bacterium]|nr:hypothetical protein [Propionibacteriaceae bacterium]